MDTKTETPFQKSNQIIALLILFLFFLIATLSSKKEKTPKGKLVGYYQIDKKTFGKWIRFFCIDLIGDLEEYKRKRTVSHTEYHLILSRLGNPSEYPTLTKKEIVEYGEGTYNSLRESIQKFPKLFGLPSYEAYLSLKKFPPNISHQILIQFG